jgi:hypothetical protein
MPTSRLYLRRMKKIVLILVLLTVQARSANLKTFCQNAVNRYRIVSEALNSPIANRTDHGDVFADIYDEVSGTTRTLYFRQLLQNEELLKMVSDNLWLTRHWKFLWKFPLVKWELDPERSHVIKGTGMFSLGRIAIELPRNGEIKITIKHSSEFSVVDIRQAIQDTEDYAKGLFPSMKIDAAGEPATTYVNLFTSSGYQANNAFIYGFLDHVQILLDRMNRKP